MLMWDNRIKQAELAAAMGIGSDSLGRKLKGERGWALAEIIDVARALDTTVAYLAGETENPHPDGPDGGSDGPPARIELATYSLRVNRSAD